MKQARIDIGVCTFRRPQLAEALDSLGAIDVPAGTRLRIVVADNDHEPSAAAIVARKAKELPHEIVHVHCPASNISIARNACLDAAEGDFLAFLDDDCAASPRWLTELVATGKATGADAVLGPVRAIYGTAAPAWMRAGDFHSTMPVFARGEIITGYTCNVLINRKSPAFEGLRFDLALGRTGGEDTQFFTQMHRAGGRLAFASEAWASEPVPDHRARFGWLMQRRFRTGQTHGRLLAVSGGRRAKALALAAAKMSYCAGAALLALPAATARNRAILRGVMHAGVIGGLAGMNEIVLYGDGKAKPALPERRGNAA